MVTAKQLRSNRTAVIRRRRFRMLNDYDIPLDTALMVTMNGQSNGLGTDTAISTTQPYANLRLSGGALVSLVETSVESPLSGFANQLTSLEPGRVSIVNNVAVSGTAIANLDIGSTPFNNSVTNIGSMAGLHAGAERAAVLLFVQGESDAGGNQATYLGLLQALQADYEDAIQAALSVTYPVHMVITQLGNWAQQGNFIDGRIADAHLDAAMGSPLIHLACPTYMLPFLTSGANLHRTAIGSRREGEYLAKSVHYITRGLKLDPLRISNAVANNNTVTLTLSGGDGSALVVDNTTMIERHTLGFHLFSDFGCPAITSAVLNADRTVTLTLNKSFASNQISTAAIHYGWDHGAAGRLGPGIGMNGGNIRDSDPTPSRSGGDPLYNWEVIQDRPLDSVTTGGATAPAYANTQSLALNGSQYVGCHGISTAQGIGTVSWSFWIRFNGSWPAAECGIWSKRVGNTRNNFEIVALPNGAMRFDVATSVSASATLQTANSVFAADTWYFVVCRYNGTNPLQIYVNGTDVTAGGTATGTPPATTRTDNPPMMIGCKSDQTAICPSMNIRDVALWTSALSGANVTTLYNGGVPIDLNTTGIGLPRSWWRFEVDSADYGLLGAASVRPFNLTRYLGATFSADNP